MNPKPVSFALLDKSVDPKIHAVGKLEMRKRDFSKEV
jgi:hypothetical protein